jgi:hypothetical protein
MVTADGNTPATGVDKGQSGTNTYKVDGTPGADMRSQIASVLVGGGFQLIELKAIRPSLEDIFVNIISQETAEEETEEDEEWEGQEDNLEEEYQEEEAEEPEPAMATPPAQERVTTKKRVRR